MARVKTIKSHQAYNLNVASAEEATIELKASNDGYILESGYLTSEYLHPSTFSTLVAALDQLLMLDESWSTTIDLKTRI
jgi:hypothetical protein